MANNTFTLFPIKHYLLWLLSSKNHWKVQIAWVRITRVSFGIFRGLHKSDAVIKVCIIHGPITYFQLFSILVGDMFFNQNCINRKTWNLPIFKVTEIPVAPVEISIYIGKFSGKYMGSIFDNIARVCSQKNFKSLINSLKLTWETP